LAFDGFRAQLFMRALKYIVSLGLVGLASSVAVGRPGLGDGGQAATNLVVVHPATCDDNRPPSDDACWQSPADWSTLMPLIVCGGNEPVLLASPIPGYPADAIESGVAGEVAVDVIVGTQGQVLFVNSMTGDLRLQAAVRAVVCQAHFTPPTDAGERTNQTGQIRYQFVLDSSAPSN
jgi:TonB family protein